MAQFTIPKGRAYTFTVKVIEKDSFLPQDLTHMSTAKFSLHRTNTMCLYDTPVNGTVVDAVNGVLSFTLSDVYTDGLEFERGPAVDGYYSKPTYNAVIDVTFNDGTLPITALSTKVYVQPMSC